MIADDVALLQTRLVEEFHLSPELFEEIARVESLLAETYRDRFLYELLQNSDDAGSTAVHLELRRGSFTWENDGRSMTAEDVESLCRSARSTKKMRDASIGYRGIGFKSLAVVAQEILVESSDASFEFSRDLARRLVGTEGATVPLIRIPADIRVIPRREGTRFTVRTPDEVSDWAVIEPLSMLFLRNVDVVRTTRVDGNVHVLRKRRTGDRVDLSVDDGPAASFSLRELGDDAQIAVPLNARALTLTGVRGRLCCFLPLVDTMGLPCVVSGRVMTDPSRTHAALEDSATLSVIRAAASNIFEILGSKDDPLFERVWELCMLAEDPRVALSSKRRSAQQIFWSSIRQAASERRLPAKYAAVPFQADEVDFVIQPGTPRALYLQANSAAAKAVRPVLRLEPLDVAATVSLSAAAHLSSETSRALVAYIRGDANAFGRTLTGGEQQLVDYCQEMHGLSTRGTAGDRKLEPFEHEQVDEPSRSALAHSPSHALGSYLQSWRAAEKSVESYLNDLGWRVSDVSHQNLGYDLSGEDSTGGRVFVEVKKVDGLNSRFSITSNEMSFLQSNPDAFFFAIVVGQGRGAQLYLVQGGDGAELPFERVCRRWDWECSDWIANGRRI